MPGIADMRDVSAYVPDRMSVDMQLRLSPDRIRPRGRNDVPRTERLHAGLHSRSQGADPADRYRLRRSPFVSHPVRIRSLALSLAVLASLPAAALASTGGARRSRWQAASRSGAGFVARHPTGL
jgi:hypothetical protein